MPHATFPPIQPLPGEKWRLASTGRHIVSTEGRVWSCYWGRLMGFDKERGYRGVRLGKRFMFVHRLVLETFVGPCPPGMEALHRNGNPSDNSLSNLHWGTKIENAADMLRHGTHRWASQPACANGHEYTEENTYRHPNGRRICRECRKAYKRAWRSKRSAQLLDVMPEAVAEALATTEEDAA